MSEVDARQPPSAQVAQRFAEALAGGEFDVAHRLMSPTLAAGFSATQLKHEYEAMFSYAGVTKADRVEVLQVMDRWPGKERQDVGWAYVSIDGPNATHGGMWCEAVAVTVEDHNGQLLIREIEWGRP